MGKARHDVTRGDLIVPTNATPLYYGALTVGAHTLGYKGHTYRCNQVSSISFDWMRTNKIGAGINQSMELQFRLPDVRGRISLYTDQVFTVYHPFRSIRDKHVTLYSIFAHLAEQSLRARLTDYLSQLRENGQVIFDNCHLVADGTLIQGKSVFKLDDPLLRVKTTPSWLYFWRVGSERTGVSKWVLGPWSEYITLNQSIDRDVIQHLFQSMFRLNLAA